MNKNMNPELNNLKLISEMIPKYIGIPIAMDYFLSHNTLTHDAPPHPARTPKYPPVDS